MNYTIVTDSVSCMPEAEFKRRSIKLFPLAVSFEGVKYVDTVSEQALLPMHAAARVGVKANSLSITPTTENIRKFVLDELVPHFDTAFFFTPGSTFTPIYEICKSVADSIAADAKAIRNEKSISTPFRINYVSTKTALAGQGLVALYADDLLRAGTPLSEFSAKVSEFAPLVQSIVVIRDIIYARHRQKLKGNDSMSLPAALLAKALQISPISKLHNNELVMIDVKTRGFNNSVNKVFEFCIEQIAIGLATPMINISVAGDPASLHQYNSFKRLQQECNKRNITLHLGVMTLAGSIQIGSGTVSVGIAPLDKQATPS
jgi:fatty acid-binding protein DegV